MFYCMQNSYTFCRHLGPQNLRRMNTKNQLIGKKKNHFPYCPFKMDFVTFNFLSIVYYLIKCII